MSVATEISRLQAARNKIRAKAVELGIGTSNDQLDTLATEIDAIENRGAVSAQVQDPELSPASLVAVITISRARP